jgi:hypothetical protein
MLPRGITTISYSRSLSLSELFLIAVTEAINTLASS